MEDAEEESWWEGSAEVMTHQHSSHQECDDEKAEKRMIHKKPKKTKHR
jgi:hypothetical protein